MNDGLSDDIKKKFMLPVTIELQDHKEEVFHNARFNLAILSITATIRTCNDNAMQFQEIIALLLHVQISVCSISCRNLLKNCRKIENFK